MSMKRLLLVAVFLCLRVLTAKGAPFQVWREPSYRQFTVFGNIDISIPIARLVVSDDLFIDLSLRHQIKQSDYGEPYSAWGFPVLVTSLYPAERDSFIWRVPGGDVFRLRACMDGTYRAGEWILNRTADGRHALSGISGWKFLYYAGQLESAETPSGVRLQFEAKHGLIHEMSIVFNGAKRVVFKCTIEEGGNIKEVYCGSHTKFEYGSGRRLRVLTDSKRGVLLQAIYLDGLLSKVRTAAESDWEDVVWSAVPCFKRGDNLWPKSVRAIKIGLRNAEYSESRDLLVVRVSENSIDAIVSWNLRTGDTEIKPQRANGS